MPEAREAGGWVPAASWLDGRQEEESGLLDWLFLTLVTLLALLVRFFHLGHQSFWADEILTWRMCRPEAGLVLWEQLLDAIQGPLYLLAVWPLARWGEAEALLRLPAALAGVATVPVLALCAGRIFGSRTARLAALLLAISPFHVWYSQEARGYTLLILFTVASSLVLLEMARKGPRPATAILYALLSAATVWSNLSGLFLWGSHLVTVLFVIRPGDRRSRWLWAAALAGGVVAVLPWLLKAVGIFAVDRLVPGAETGAALRGETTFTPLAYPFTGFAFFFGYSLGPSLAELHLPDRLAVIRAALPYLLPAGAIALTALLSGILHLRRRQWVLLIWIILPLIAVSFLAWRNIKPFNPRYLAIVFPWVLMLAAHGLLSLPRRWGIPLAALLLAFFLWSLGGHAFNPRFAKADLRGAATLVARQGSVGEPVLLPVATSVFKHYYHGPGELVENFDFTPLANKEAARTWLRERQGNARSGWLVLARAWRVDPHGWLAASLAEDGLIRSDTQLAGVRVIRWRMPAAEVAP